MYTLRLLVYLRGECMIRNEHMIENMEFQSDY